MKTCGATKDPEGWACVLPGGRHSAHTDGEHVWDDPAVIAEMAAEREQAKAQKTTRRRASKASTESLSRLYSMNARPEERATPDPGVPPEAEAAWKTNSEAWLFRAEGVVHRFLKEHAEPFTTPEAIWPLLDKPPEMRAFSLVVRTALRRGWIQETGAVRLRGTYTTRDGHRFLMNKLVPVYRSTLA